MKSLKTKNNQSSPALTPLQQLVRTLTECPGIYRMLDPAGHILYIGKARNLRKRVSSYVRNPQQLDIKTRALMEQVTNIEVTVTSSETEALLLEQSLINKNRPKYNILLRDDKSYPYIHISAHPDFPRLDLRRGHKASGGQYFGPYTNTYAARESLNVLHKIFRLRQCNDTFFSNRTRPCLEYQLKRCTAPCVGYINKEEYQHDVDHTRLFLQGKNQQVIDDLAAKMLSASENKNFELAAHFRDQISHLRHVQTQQYITHGNKECDVWAIAFQLGHACVQLLTIRGGQLLGNRPFWIKALLQDNPADILETVIEQYYLNPDHVDAIPSVVLVNQPLPEKDLVVESLKLVAQHTIKIIHQPRGEFAKLLTMAIQNAEQALVSRLASSLHWQQQWQHLQEWFQLPDLKRIECFDASHTMGEATVVSCVVFDEQGAAKRAYRRFNIDTENFAPGNDYAAIEQALRRRYKRLLESNTDFPEVVIIDGGKGAAAYGRKSIY